MQRCQTVLFILSYAKIRVVAFEGRDRGQCSAGNFRPVVCNSRGSNLNEKSPRSPITMAATVLAKICLLVDIVAETQQTS